MHALAAGTTACWRTARARPVVTVVICLMLCFGTANAVEGAAASEGIDDIPRSVVPETLFVVKVSLTVLSLCLSVLSLCSLCALTVLSHGALSLCSLPLSPSTSVICMGVRFLWIPY